MCILPSVDGGNENRGGGRDRWCHHFFSSHCVYRKIIISAPIVVIGTTRDPATPYEWSVRLRDQLAELERAQLVRVGPPLDPSRAYVFAGFPHGISAISAFANLVVDPPLPVAGEGDDEQDGDDGDDGAGEQEAQSKPAPAAAAGAAVQLR